jgi:hypothetical protein
MPVKVTLLCYVALMVSLALIVRWERLRQRKGPSLKLKNLDQIDGLRINYTPPPDRSKRAFERRP